MKHIRSLILALVLSAGLAPALAQAPPPVPALPDAERRTSYVIAASTCACAVGFQLYQDSTDVANWIKVYINGVEIPQSGNWNITSPSSSIATLPRPITDAVLTFTTARTGTVQIVGAQRPRRLSEYAENRGVAARDLNQAINGIEAQLREMWDRQFRTVQAPPGETLNMLPAQASRASMGACFDSSGNLAPCVAAAGSFVAGTSIGFTGTNPTTISYTGATYSAGSGISFTGTNPTVISVSQATSVPVLQSRAIAIAQDLSAYTVIQTAGYGVAGDGGAATFQKISGGTPFVDSFIATGAITDNGASACTNGTYFGQIPNSPNTQGFQSAFIIVVAGNVVTTIQNTAPGNGYAAGTVLTFTVPGCTSAPRWTINTVTTPSGSFTDAAGNKWQIVYPANGLDARAMGVKFDWTVSGGDAVATDNLTTLQNAINFAAYAPGFIDTGSVNGGRVLLPRNTAKFCGSNGAVPLKVWNGVTVEGQGSTASVLKVCDTWINTTNFVELCDVASHVSCFGASLRHMQIFALFSLGTGSISPTTQAAVYTNSCQQQGCGIYDTIIYSGACRRGIWAELGYGGASVVPLIDEVEIKGGEKSALCGGGTPGAVVISGYISTQIPIGKLTLSGLSTSSGFGPRDLGFVVTGGFVQVKTLYVEQVVSGAFINIPTSLTNGMVHINGFSGGPDCVNGVTRQAGSIANSVKLEMAFANSCTNTYNNAGAGSGAITQLADVVF